MDIDQYDWLARVGYRFSILMFAAIGLIIVNFMLAVNFIDIR